VEKILLLHGLCFCYM